MIGLLKINLDVLFRYFLYENMFFFAIIFTINENIENDYLIEYTFNPRYLSSLIYKGIRKSDGLEVIIKKLDSSIFSDEDEVTSEYKILASLNHENIVKTTGPMYTFKTMQNDDFQMAFVMEKCNGGTLWDYIEKMWDSEVNYNELLEILRSILFGLKYIHSKHVTHGDLKTTDIMFHNGIIKIIDFGESQIAPNKPSFYIHVEERNLYPQYPPEVCDQRFYTTSADMWAFGQIMKIFAMMTVRFNSLDHKETFHIHFNDLKNKCIDINPETRITSNEALKHQIFNYLYPLGISFINLQPFEKKMAEIIIKKQNNELICEKGELVIKIIENIKISQCGRTLSEYIYFINGNKYDKYDITNENLRLINIMFKCAICSN